MSDTESTLSTRGVADLIERHLAEQAVWGHLPAAMRFKQALVERVGVPEAFAVCRGTLPVPGLETLRRRAVRGMREAARDEGQTFRELWPRGAPFVLPDPRVLGGGNHAPIPALGRSAYLAGFTDVLVRGRSALLLRRDDALIDYEGDELSRFRDNFEFDPGVLSGTTETLWTMEPEAPQWIVDEAFTLVGGHTIDFGHWMVEYLPKLMIARLSGLEPRVPILIDERMPPSHRQALELFAPDAEILVVPHLAPVHVNRLWSASNPMYMGFYPTTWPPEIWGHTASEPAKSAALVRELVKAAGTAVSQTSAVERVFLARKAQKKKLLNTVEIEGIARAKGFVTVYPEELSFAEQLRLLRHARYVVGPEGSAFFLCMFCQPGSRACMFNPEFTYPLADTSAVLKELGVELTILSGSDRTVDEDWPFWVDYEVDPDVFAQFLDGWLAEDG